MAWWWSRAERKRRKEETEAEARVLCRQQEAIERFERETLDAAHRASQAAERAVWAEAERAGREVRAAAVERALKQTKGQSYRQ